LSRPPDNGNGVSGTGVFHITAKLREFVRFVLRDIRPCHELLLTGGNVVVRVGAFWAIAASVALSSCAGRDAQPISTVQQQDAYSDCTMIKAEIDANNQKAQQLANEQGMKVAQNVAAGVVGLVIWPVWFGMDFKGAAGQDAANLQARQEYLTQLAVQRCAPGYRPPPHP
jgi:hypothetical protein